MFAATNFIHAMGDQVLFDAEADGGTTGSGASISTSWTHTASGNYRVVIVAITILCGVNANYSTHTATVTYGGNTMTSLGGIHCDATNNYPFMEWFYLLNPPLGPQTVSVSYSRTSASYRRLYGTSLSYTGCRGVTGPVSTGSGTEAGTALSQTASAAVKEMLVQGFLDYQALWSGSIGSYNKNERYNLPAAGGNKDNAMVVGDAPGTGSSVTFTATRYASSAYAEFCIKLTNTP